MNLEQITDSISDYLTNLESTEEKINAINQLRLALHEHSPFDREPVDCVLWVKSETVVANDYNPNVMAPVEKRLLQRSLEVDGFTQPVVVSEKKDTYVVVDGFHRHLLGSAKGKLQSRMLGYLPITTINKDRQGEAERIAATIRHNRARGKHQIASMSDIVRDLYRLGWADERIAQELGMDADEVLRLKQISGLTELFMDETFSDAWTVR